MIRAEPLIDGAAAGPVMRLDAPISFWGGVDPETGRISDPRHPAHGQCIAGTVLALAATRGSSSSSAVMLELIRGGRAPAALILAEIDAILTLGVVVAGEMGYPTLPVLRLGRAEQEALVPGQMATVHAGGGIELA